MMIGTNSVPKDYDKEEIRTAVHVKWEINSGIAYAIVKRFAGLKHVVSQEAPIFDF